MLALIIQRIRKHRAWILALSAVVVFCTTYALILPALTLEQDEAAKQGGIDLLKTEQSADKQDTDVSGDPQSKDTEKKDVKAKEPSDSAKAENPDPKEADKTDSAKADKTVSESDKDGLAFEGKGYSITAKAGSDAKLPEDTELSAKEVKSDEKDYRAWVDEAEKALKESPRVKDEVSVKSAKFYDITLMSDGREVEPAADVNVKITYDEALKMSKSGDVYVVHFGVDKNGKLKPEVLKDNAVEVKSKTGQKAGTIEVSDIAFDASEFSMYGVLETTTLEETVVTADGKNYKISVTYDADAKVPEGAKLAVSEIGSDDSKYDDYVAKSEKALDMDKGSAGYARLFDIKIVDKDGNKVKIQAPVDVKIELADKEDKEKAKVVHFADGSDKGTVVDGVAVDGKTVSFETDGFSVYAVFGGEDTNARIQVDFHAYDEEGNEKVTTMYVKASDSAEALEMILYDPGVGKLNDGEMFRGWTQNENYTAAQATSSYNATSNPNGAMTIEDVREWAQALQADGIVETDPIKVYNFYPMIVKNYTVTYLDRFGVSLDTASAYMLRNETVASFTVNMNYETNDDDYHFKGWISNDQGKITLAGEQPPELEQVTILDDLEYTSNPYNLYKNNTAIKITGDVVFKAHAPKGKWLIFHEVEKGATYVAPQFLEEGDSADMPNPNNMHLLGYTFAGWYKGDPIYGDDGVTVIGATPNYNEDHRYNGEPIDQKTHVYAKWEPATLAPYTVIIWKQNLDGTYSYAESVKLGGVVGDNISNLGHLNIVNNNDADYLRISGTQLNDNQTALVNYTKTYQIVHSRTGAGSVNNPYVHHYYTEGTTTESEYVGFNCARIEYEDLKIKPEGTSIVNVYYDRITYTVRVYYARSNTARTQYYVATGRNNEGTNPIGPSSNNFGMTYASGAIQWHRDGDRWAQGYYSSPINPQYEDSGGYRYYYTTITAKYGANIADQWPKYSSFPDLDTDNTHTSNNNNSSGYLAFVSWYMMNDAAGYRGAGSGLNTFKGVINKMDEKLLGDITRGTDGVNVLFGRYDTRPINIYTYKIWKEALLDENGNPIIPAGKDQREGPDGLIYYLDESIQANSNAQPSGTQAPNYIGFENFQTDKPADNNQSGRREDIVCWYHRVKNPIIYRDGSYFDGNGNRLNAFPPQGQPEESEPIPYETNIESYNGGYNAAGVLVKGDNYKTDYPSSYDGFVFEGWYIDEACTQRYNFTVMPDSSITVYAKFRQVQYRVFLHPQVPTGKYVSWGSDTQAMSFRGTYGANISLPTGKLIKSEEETEIYDDSYEFAGWYRDPQGKQPFDPDAYVLNDDLASPYDKTTEMTDYMDKYGVITDGPNGEPPFNSDIIGNNGGDRWWIDSKIELYGKWIKKMDAGEGIRIIYDPNGGSTEVKDDTLYKDQTNVVAQSAPVTPPKTTITHADGTEEEVDRVFLYWVLQKWDPDANNGQGAFVDVAPMEFVYPGDSFTASFANAHSVTTTDPETGLETTEHFIQLRAEYNDPGAETPTHIWWYSNFGDNDVIKTNKTSEDADPVENIGINEAVIIKPKDTFTRPGFKFLGWARVDTTDDEGEPIEGHPALHPELGPDDLFLKYVEASDDTSAHFEAKDSDNEWVTVTQIAADEKYPYHDLYAVWAKLYSVTVIKNVVGTDDDKDRTYSFESTGLTPDEDTFSLYGREKTDNNNEVTQTNRKVYTDIPQYTEFQLTEDDYTNDFVTTIEATYTYVNDKGETVTETIALDPDRDNKLSTGELTVNGNTTITYTNTRKALKVSIWKTDEGYTALTGAKFVLYKAEDYDDTTEQPKAGATPVMAETEVGTNGLLLLDVVDGEIPLGEYRLVETAAPAGYNLADSAIKIFLESGVSATQDGNVSEVYVKGDQYWVVGQDNDTHQIRVWNNPGAELPSTGGPGTTWIYLIGSILLLGCGITLIARRRIRSN